MTHDDMTPTERQAAIIADLEARVTLLTDDLFYARASVARMTVELEQANRKLEHRDAEIAMLRAASDNADDKPAKRPTNKTPRTDAHVDQLASHLVHPHWITFARGLERENAALRKERDSYRYRSEQIWGLRKEIQAALGVPSDCEGEEALKQGLAAIKTLRKDKERLDWLETLDCDSHWWVHIADSTNLRAAIDAARKEAHP